MGRFSWLFKNCLVQLTLKQHRGWGATPLHPKNSESKIWTYSQPSLHLVPPYPWFCISGFKQAKDCVVLRYIFIEKSPCISEPMKFKPLLFKGQLHFYLSGASLCWWWDFPLLLHWKVDITEQGGLREVCLVCCSAQTSPFHMLCHPSFSLFSKPCILNLS